VIDYDVEKEMGRRVSALFAGLNPEAVKTSLEDLIDEYTCAQYGVSIIHEMKKVKLASGNRCVTIQTLAKGRAVLTSAYGFKVLKQDECGKCKGTYLVLDECSKEDFDKEREQHG
jgi:predicted methyltransferase